MRSHTLVYRHESTQQSGSQMEAWITCEKNRKFSKALETLLLFLLMFFHAPRSVKSSLCEPNINNLRETMSSTPLSASYKTHLRGNHSLTPAIYSFNASCWPWGVAWGLMGIWVLDYPNSKTNGFDHRGPIRLPCAKPGTTLRFRSYGGGVYKNILHMDIQSRHFLSWVHLVSYRLVIRKKAF